MKLNNDEKNVNAKKDSMIEQFMTLEEEYEVLDMNKVHQSYRIMC